MKTVGVIGSGPAGLAVIKELKQAGLEPTAFERLGSVGGRWARDAGDTGIWKELCLNLSRRWMEYSDFPWDETTVPTKHRNKEFAGLFAHHEETTEYFEAYAKNFDLLPYIRFKTDVVSAVKDEDDGGWTVVTKEVDGGKETTHKFDALVVCSGTYEKKHHPLAEDLREYTGELMHAEQFKSIKDYKGEKVLVIGSSISGPEISSALASEGECENVASSIRHVNYHMTKISKAKENKPYDDLMFIRFPAWLGRILPDSAMADGLKSALLDNFPIEYQLAKGENCYDNPEPDIAVAGVSASVNYVEMVQDGRLQVVPGIESVNDKTVAFTDGSSGEYDVIICGTGYGPIMSFFNKDMQDKLLFKAAGGKNEAELYHDCLVPDIANLGFCGIGTIVGPASPAFEMQARLLAGVFSGNVRRPSLAKMKKVTKAEREGREFSKFKQYKNAVFLMEEIGDDLGVTPSVFKALWEPKKYLFSPCYPVQYRMNAYVDGEENAKKAKERFEYYLANPQVATF